ncbi:hypothetical protein GCM10020254_47010 [Streptomyces goshikiensis]
MDDDLGVPQALAIVHTTVRQGNSALAADDKDAAIARLSEVRAMLGVLGLDPLDPHWAGEADRGEDLHGAVDTLVRLVLGAAGVRAGPQGLGHGRRHPRPAPAVRAGHRGQPERTALDTRPALSQAARPGPGRQARCAARRSGRHTLHTYISQHQRNR